MFHAYNVFRDRLAERDINILVGHKDSPKRCATTSIACLISSGLLLPLSLSLPLTLTLRLRAPTPAVKVGPRRHYPLACADARP